MAAGPPRAETAPRARAFRHTTFRRRGGPGTGLVPVQSCPGEQRGHECSGLQYSFCGVFKEIKQVPLPVPPAAHSSGSAASGAHPPCARARCAAPPAPCSPCGPGRAARPEAAARRVAARLRRLGDELEQRRKARARGPSAARRLAAVAGLLCALTPAAALAWLIRRRSL
ncbi:activator of apoptosis harakiri [Pithys albifrons albifrons]|uniref:activator of apoptosis harakiri n=1 Tax=Pithys albifrons albifrons TaxID=3385563 RepID=UPI003A5D04A5